MAETVVLKLRSPGKTKRDWLEGTAERFRQGVQLGLDASLLRQTASRAKIHAASYAAIRSLGLPSDYCRMAVNQAVALARSHFGLRKAKRKTRPPKLVKSQGIGLGVNAYKIVGTTLRVSTGMSHSHGLAPRWPTESATINRRAIIAIVALAVAAVAALILLGPGGGEPSPNTIVADGKVKGDPNALVLVEEWGDFQ